MIRLPHSAPKARSVAYAAMALALSASLLGTSAEARERRDVLLWLQPNAIDFQKELGNPPAAGSPTQKADLEAVIAATKARTAVREKFAQEDARQTLVRFLEGMDIDISKKQTSEARALFKQANTELETMVHVFKLQSERRRPYLAEKKLVKPCPGNQPRTSSYPSTHSATGTLFAALLNEAVPELKARTEARAVEYGESRLICGFHYPTDTVAGAKAGDLVAKALLANKAFKTRFDETRKEIRTALGM
jgi:acid phosphatase (class A)